MSRPPVVPASLAALALVSCAKTSEPPRPPPVVVGIPSATARAAVAVPTVAETAAPAPSAEPAPRPTADVYRAARHEVVVTLRPGYPPCTLALDGQNFEDKPEWFQIFAVNRIATVAGDACSARVRYDSVIEAKHDWDEAPLEAGTFKKPGQTLPPHVSLDSRPNVFEDLDFDALGSHCDLRARRLCGRDGAGA